MQHIVILGIENERLYEIIKEGMEENEKLRNMPRITYTTEPKQSIVIKETSSQAKSSLSPSEKIVYAGKPS